MWCHVNGTNFLSYSLLFLSFKKNSSSFFYNMTTTPSISARKTRRITASTKPPVLVLSDDSEFHQDEFGPEQSLDLLSEIEEDELEDELEDEVAFIRDDYPVKKEKPEPEWTATSRKRKEVFERSNAHLQPLAKKTRTTSHSVPASQITPKAMRNMLSGCAVPGAPKKKDRFSNTKRVAKAPKIDWGVRKELLKQCDNAQFIDPIVESFVSIALKVSREMRNSDASSVGPIMMWSLMASFMKAIDDTPWGAWKDGDGTDEFDYVVFVQWPYGVTADVLTEKQVKFRQVLISRLSENFERKLQTYLQLPQIKVVWSKAFSDNITYA